MNLTKQANKLPRWLPAAYYLLAVLSVLLCLFLLMYSLLATVMAEYPPGLAFMKWLPVILCMIVVLMGFTLAAYIVYVGRCLKQHQHYDLCLCVAGLACLVIPLGTILGSYTLVILKRPAIKALFATDH